jgi:FixJ family two-component response regulator
MSTQGWRVSVVDHDKLVLTSLSRWLQSAGFTVEAFSSAADFLAQRETGQPGCVVADVSMPGLSRLQLQQRLAREADNRPVVFISGPSDVRDIVEAMKAGAVDFLAKPLDEERLLAAVRTAIAKDQAGRDKRAELASITARLATLTARERDVLLGVVAGKRNKQIALELGVAEKTIKIHRARMMRKMQMQSVADLVRIWTATQPSWMTF